MARERGADPLQTTALINDLYLKMVDLKRVNRQNRAHFFALCARQMRRILTDLHRAGVCQKRGGKQESIAIDASTISARATARFDGDRRGTGTTGADGRAQEQGSGTAIFLAAA